MADRIDDRIARVRAGLEAFDRGQGDAVIGALSEDIEIHAPPETGNPGTYHGHAGYRKWLGDWLDAWEGFALEIMRIEAIGETHVVAEVLQTARGRGSGIPVEQVAAFMFDLPVDTATALHLYPTWEDALAAAEARERLG
jgi:ketosteroid isomerase-like protein